MPRLQTRGRATSAGGQGAGTYFIGLKATDTNEKWFVNSGGTTAEMMVLLTTGMRCYFWM